MKTALRRIYESNFVLGAVVVLLIFGFLYLRNGPELFSGNSGGAYWDNMDYCKNNRDGQMKIYKQILSCKEIITHRQYCWKHRDDVIIVDGAIIPCDRFLGIEKEVPSPYDSY